MQTNDTTTPHAAKGLPHTGSYLPAMEARLHELLGGPDDESRARLGRVAGSIARMGSVGRVNFLLFTGSCLCAVRSGRMSADALQELIRSELQATLLSTPEGRLIERHRLLLGRMVLRHCQDKKGNLR